MVLLHDKVFFAKVTIFSKLFETFIGKKVGSTIWFHIMTVMYCKNDLVYSVNYFVYINILVIANNGNHKARRCVGLRKLCPE